MADIEAEDIYRNPTRSSAISVRRACKNYGTKRKPLVVLDNLDMVVPQGVIYGLLGSSGCGKTTLINSIVGLLKLDSGTIRVLDGSANMRRRLAFMPQEIALFKEFSIRETMKYFGWISGMDNKDIFQKLQFLTKLLEIPNLDVKIKNLSGGQQRRVSFAVALLKDSELLVLDEPTVGLDPILREIIWNHLIYITKTYKTTVVITTHYVEEMRQAHIVGLMRQGYIIAEESPTALLCKLEACTLEDAFLTLSHMQTEANSPTSRELCDIARYRFRFGNPRTAKDAVLPKKTQAEFHSQNHLKAILWKNLLWMVRNLPLMSSIILLPAVIIALFCVSYGHKPYNFDISIVNYETNSTSCDNFNCDSDFLSCHYLNYLKKSSINLVYASSENEARKLLNHGKTYAFITFPYNYSKAFKSRTRQLAHSKSWDIDFSTIEVVYDLSVSIIRDFIKKLMYTSFGEFLTDYMELCNDTSEAFSVPISWKTPIYGAADVNYTDFSGPGITLTLIFTFSAAMSACSLLIERNEGILERSLVMGVNGVELLVSHILCDGFVVLSQILTLLVCAFVIFGLTLKGSFALVFLLSFLTGLCGMSFGFALSSVLENETAAVHIVTGISTPLVLLSGIVWPVEAMHNILRSVASFFPLTVATQSMRSVLQRGWTLSEPQVYYGCTYLSGLSIVFLIISVISLKCKNTL